MVRIHRFGALLALPVLLLGSDTDAAVDPLPTGVAVRPVDGGVVQPFRAPVTRYGAGHRGVDLRARPGTPVRAAIGGTVTFAGMVAGTPWVTVNHGGGLSTTYGALSPRLVRAGDHVGTGELLGFLSGGMRHLDWGARLDGTYIDPLSLLARWETYLTTEDDDGFAALGGVASGGGGPNGYTVPVRGGITSGFGPRIHPVTGAHRVHAGIDIAAPTGTPVRAAAQGTVEFAGEISGYGRTVILDHGGGSTTLYGHQSSVGVSTGESVRAGEPIGAVGMTGTATGPHLHFELRMSGAPVDPARWLP